MLTRTTQKTRRPSIPEMITEAGRMLSTTVQNVFEPMDFLEGVVETPSEAGSTSYRADRTNTDLAPTNAHKGKSRVQPKQPDAEPDLLGVGMSLRQPRSQLPSSRSSLRERASEIDLREDFDLSDVNESLVSDSCVLLSHKKEKKTDTRIPTDSAKPDQNALKKSLPAETATGSANLTWAWQDVRRIMTYSEPTAESLEETFWEGF